MPSQLGIYLRSHEAGARAGYDLFRRAAKSQRDRPYADELRRLTHDIGTDLEALRALMRALGVTPNPVLGGVLQLGERAGRLKPNGHVLRRAPLSDLVELEGCRDAVAAKSAAWEALAALGIDARVPAATAGWLGTTELRRRAEDQTARLRALHQAAPVALSGT